MSMSDSSVKYKRTNLFLLRVWCDDAEENSNEQGNEVAGPGLIWHGKLQRTVSGEAHSFDGLEGLIEVLEAMICNDQPEHSGPRVKRRPKAGLSANGNNQREAM